jgi:RNA polymerase sigma-70 factor, ECF subfamily
VKDGDGELVADASLAVAAAGGSRTAFAALLERHYDRVFRMAWRWTGSQAEAEDIAQDVCVKLAGALRSYRGDAAFSTWLHRVAYNVMIDRARSRRQETLPGTDNVIALFDRADMATPETALLGAELWAAVRALPPQQRDAVLLIYAQDLSHKEAAVVMGCSEKTVSWHVHEAKKRLKGILEAVG